MQKKNYQAPEIGMQKFELHDIVRTSLEDGIGVSYDQGKWGVTTKEDFE